MSRALLFSGGMDSLAAWRLLGAEHRVYVRIGAPYESRELESIERRGLLPGLQVVDAVPGLGLQADGAGRVPLRNLLFAITAAAVTGADEVVLGALAGETSGDKSRSFAAAATAAMTASEGRQVRLWLPFRGTTKAQLVRRYMRQAGNPFLHEADLRESPSCYAATLPHGIAGCGACMSCLRRWVAMSLNGIHERYLQDPAAQDLHGHGGWWKFMRRTPLRDWTGVARVNAELLLALRRARA